MLPRLRDNSHCFHGFGAVHMGHGAGSHRSEQHCGAPRVANRYGRGCAGQRRSGLGGMEARGALVHGSQ
eukprot:4633838-Prymnesium_polylepis.2